MWRVKLGPSFFGSTAICLGSQLATVVRLLDTAAPGLCWFATDLSVLGTNLSILGTSIDEASGLRSLGGASTATRWLDSHDQFVSGVFFAVLDGANPEIRAQADTEDPEWAQLGNAIFEMRAFDTSWIEITSANQPALARTFPRMTLDCRS